MTACDGKMPQCFVRVYIKVDASLTCSAFNFSPVPTQLFVNACLLLNVALQKFLPLLFFALITVVAAAKQNTAQLRSGPNAMKNAVY